MKRNLFALFILLFGVQAGIAQSITAKVIDAKSGESIPYANIRVKDSDNLISNSEGYFTIPENKSGDDSMLTVSYLGYANRQMTIMELKSQQLIIRLEPAVYELESVKVSSIKPNPYTIMGEVKKNLARNYRGVEQPSKDVLFYRNVNTFKPEKIEAEMTESTRLTKKGLQAANADLVAFSSKLISHPPQQFNDMLCNYYTARKKDNNGKLIFSPKLEVVKATKLLDENRTISIDDVDDAMEKVFYKHLDSTKYYRAKTGLFGIREGHNDSISSSKIFNKKKNKKRDDEKREKQLSSSKWSIVGFMSDNNFLNNYTLDFVNKPELYEYTYEGALYSNENEFVYVLNFKPKKGDAKYTGKLYVSESDYAVVRADYTLAEGETLDGFNVKLLFGIKYSENFSKGTVIYKQKSDKTGYYLQYASAETGEYVYVNRPLKFIEKTIGKKDVVAFDIKIEANSRDRKEFFNISRGEITEAEFDEIKEKDFNFINLKRYDPKIWKDCSAIEPLEEMKQFRVLD